VDRVRVTNAGNGGWWWRVPLALVAWAPLAASLGAAAVVVAVYARYARDVPDVPDLDAYAAAAPRSNLILAADGTLLAQIPFVVGVEAGHRTWVPYAELPPLVVDAVLAAEDVRFFSHHGVDERAVVRAAVANYRAGRTVEGASTITQQVARNLLPEAIGRERTLRRKVREMVLARRIERRYPKAKILETYVNLVFLGAGAYGVEAAARVYFDRSLAELSLAQAALVAGMAQAPTRTNPFEHPAEARARRDEVLAKMTRAGFVGAAEAARAQAEPLSLSPAPDHYGTRSPWITEWARQEVEAAYPQAWARGGMVVTTTALPALDALALAAARTGSDAIAARQKSAAPEVGAIVFDHHTGYVEAVVGGLDWARSRFDRARSACRQPGSTFKPIVYAAALERDVITLGTPLRDAPVTEYDEDRDSFWKPQNSGRAFRGIALAEDALAASLNAPAVDVIDRVGPAAAVDMARRLGISSPLAAVRPLVLGASCVTPLELVRAFAIFAEAGQSRPPIVITRVEWRGAILVERAAGADPFASPSRRLDGVVAALPGRATILDDVTAHLVGHMLVAAASRGTGAKSRAVARPVAGKTGTTNDASDAWFVGYTARAAAVVWVGHDDPKTKLGRREDGSRAALPIWTALVRLVEADRPVRPALGPAPSGIEMAAVSRESGRLVPRLALGGAPGGAALELPFRTGTAPTDGDEALPVELGGRSDSGGRGTIDDALGGF
jgi:penicillin-binding protein 1A